DDFSLGQNDLAQAVKEIQLQRGIEPARDAAPHDPGVGPAVGRRRQWPAGDWVFSRRMHQLPQLLNAKSVQRIAEARPKAEAGQIEPTCLMLRRPPALLRDFKKEFPQPAAKPGGPFLARRIQGRFQRLGEFLRRGLWLAVRGKRAANE